MKSIERMPGSSALQRISKRTHKKAPHEQLKTLNEEDEKAILKIVKANRWKPWSELAREFEALNPGKKCGRDRIRKICWKHGIQGRVAKKRPHITQATAQKRLAFARKYEKWDAFDWEGVMFLDESMISLWGNDCGRGPFVKCGKKSIYKPECTKHTKKHGGKKNIKVWAGVWAFGVTDLVKIEGALTGEKYRCILAENLEENVEKMKQNGDMEVEAIHILQDNDPKHASKIARHFFDYKPYSKMDFPPTAQIWI